MYTPPDNAEPIEVYALGTFVSGMTERINELKERLAEPDNAEWFNNLWHNNANVEQWYEFVHTFEPTMTFRQWDIAWQWRTILHDDQDQARLEFINAILGWY